jgi:hypothetical protein
MVNVIIVSSRHVYGSGHQAAQYNEALAEGRRFDRNQPASQWALKKIWERTSQIFTHSKADLHPHIID